MERLFRKLDAASKNAMRLFKASFIKACRAGGWSSDLYTLNGDPG